MIVILGLGKQTAKGNWTVGYDLTGVSESDVSEKGFRVYPNPADGAVTIVGGNGDYCITNMLGQRMMTGQLYGDSQQVDVSRLSSGMYFLTIGNKTKKLMVK